MTNSRKFDRLIEISKALKLTHQTGRTFHVSFLLNGSNIVVIGTNNYSKSNVISSSYKRTKFNYGDSYVSGIHSEMFVLGRVKYKEDISNLTLVNIRIDNNNLLNYSAPCVNCSWRLGKAGLKTIWYSTKDGFEKFQ